MHRHNVKSLAGSCGTGTAGRKDRRSGDRSGSQQLLAVVDRVRAVIWLLLHVPYECLTWAHAFSKDFTSIADC